MAGMRSDRARARARDLLRQFIQFPTMLSSAVCANSQWIIFRKPSALRPRTGAHARIR